MRFSRHMTVTPDPNFRNEKSQRNVSCTPQKGWEPKQCNGPRFKTGCHERGGRLNCFQNQTHPVASGGLYH